MSPTEVDVLADAVVKTAGDYVTACRVAASAATRGKHTIMVAAVERGDQLRADLIVAVGRLADAANGAPCASSSGSPSA